MSDDVFMVVWLIALISAVVGLSLYFAVFRTLRDIRKRKNEASTDLFSRFECLQMAFGSVSDGVVICDHDGNVTYLNPISEGLTGWSSREARGQAMATVLRLVNKDGKAEVDIPAAVAAGEGAIFQLANNPLLRSKSGAEVPIEGSASPILDVHRSITGAVMVFREVTEKHNEALQLDEAAEFANRFSELNRRRNDFITTLAHELRNPLAPIRNAVQLMGMHTLEPEIDYLRQLIARQVDQLVQLIDDLVDVSRVSGGTPSLSNQIVSLPEIISAAVEASSTFIEETGQKLIVNVSVGSSVFVNGDPLRLTQVISILLKNSSRYSDAGARIELSLVLEGKVAVITVRDYGIGIAPDVLPCIFQSCSKAGDTPESGSAELGVGLTLVKALVEMHNGSVIAQSDGVGKGSVFTVRLPAVDAPSEQCRVVPASEPEAVSTRSLRVLVVEDVRTLRMLTTRLLEKLGHHVECVENAGLALQKLDTFTPDVVISDIAMPEMTGYELARRIRRREDCAHVCLVAITGAGQSSDRRTAIEAGFDEYFVKPVDIAVLQSLLAKLSKSPSEPSH